MAHISRRREPAARLRARARTCTARPPPRCSASPLDEVEQRAAPLRQGDQLRPDLRHERVRPGAEPRHRRAAPRRPTSSATSRAIPGVEALHGRDAQARARSAATSRRCSAAACGCPRSKRRAGPRRAGRRARGDQRADAGHRRRPDQAGDDRGAEVARRRAAEHAADHAGARRAGARGAGRRARARARRAAASSCVGARSSRCRWSPRSASATTGTRRTSSGPIGLRRQDDAPPAPPGKCRP